MGFESGFYNWSLFAVNQTPYSQVKLVDDVKKGHDLLKLKL